MKSTKSHAAVFFICPIGEPGSVHRTRSDAIFEKICQPLAESLRSEVERADQLEESGIIIDQILWYLLYAKVVVADLAGGNPNVMYELAIRHTTGKPCLCLGLPGEKSPYDIAPLRLFQVDESDQDSLAKTRDSLIKITREIERAGRGPKSPISEALGVWRLRADFFAFTTTDFDWVFTQYGVLRVLLAQNRESLQMGNVPGSFWGDLTRELDKLEETLDLLRKKSGLPSLDSYVRAATVLQGPSL